MTSREKQLKLINAINEEIKLLPIQDPVVSQMSAALIRNKIKNGEFSPQLIQDLARLQDAEKGIVWHIKDSPLGTEPKILIRDARKLKSLNQVSNSNDQHIWKIQAISTYLSLDKLIDIKKNDERVTTQELLNLEKLKQKVKQDIKIFCESIEDIDSQTIKKKIKKLNQKIINDLYSVSKNIVGERLDEQLRYAKDYFSFDIEHFHQVTLYNQKDNNQKEHKVYEASIILNDLTLEQVIMFQAIKEYKKGVEVKLKNSDLSMAWFNKMPEGKKELLKQAASDILQGKKSINTQLTDLPLFRNAFLKYTVVNNDLSNALVTNSGAIAVLKSKDKKSLKILNNFVVEQVKKNITNSGEKLHVNNLVSPFNKIPGSKDSDVVKYTQEAVRQAGGIYSNSPFNGFRRIFGGGIINKGQKQNLKEIAKIAKAINCNQLAQFLEGINRNYNKSLDEINKLQESDQIKTDLIHALKARKYLNEGTSFFEFDKKNKNVLLVNELKLVNSSVNNGALKALINKKNIIVNVFQYIDPCKSAKDRHGISQTEGSRIYINDQLNSSNDNNLCIENLDIQVAAGHQQQLAGQNIGQNGIKKEVRNTDLPDRSIYNKIHYQALTRDTASTNKMPKVSYKIRFIESLSKMKRKLLTLIKNVFTKTKNNEVKFVKNELKEVRFITTDKVSRNNSFNKHIKRSEEIGRNLGELSENSVLAPYRTGVSSRGASHRR